MSRVRFLALVGVAAAGALLSASSAQAGWGPTLHPRVVVGGHPYHNGNYFVPPSSAYEAVRVFPPARYGYPAYYMPQSYLPAGMAVNPGWTGYGYPMGYHGAGYGSFGYGQYHPAYGY